MAGIMNSSTFAKDLWPGVKNWYGLAYNDHQTEYTQVFETETSDKAYEEEVGVVGLGLAPVKPEGEGISYAAMKQGYVKRYTNVAYALGFIITLEAYEDGKSPKLAKQRSRALARSMRLTKETVGANVFNRGFNSSYVGGDGKEFFATDHPNVSGGTWANELAVAADLSEEALEQALLEIDNYVDDVGMKIAVRAMKLVIPPALQFDAARILRSDKQSGTNANDVNAIKELGLLPQGFMKWHYLTDTDAWFIKTDCPDGAKYIERRADTFDMDNDFGTKNAQYAAYGRYSFGWTDPHGYFGSPGI
jgi:hypothetical protein